MNKIIFFDMDGVLADFDKALNGDFRNMFKPGFFRGLEPMENGLNDTIRGLQARGYTVKILSKACVKRSDKRFRGQLVDKANWVKEYLPSIDELDIIIQATDESKGDILKYYSKDDKCFLVDDYTPNLATWAFAGGECIKKAKRKKHTRTFEQILELNDLLGMEL